MASTSGQRLTGQGLRACISQQWRWPEHLEREPALVGPRLASIGPHGYPVQELIVPAPGGLWTRLTSTGHHVVHLVVERMLWGGR